jgi:hypothetical protein
MNQMTTMFFIITGMILLFYIAGIDIDNPLLNILLNPQNVSTSDFWQVTLLGAVSAISAIVVGFVTKDIEKSVMAIIMPVAATYLWTFWQVYKIMVSASFISAIFALLFFGPVSFYFAFLCFDYWRGRD